MDEILAEGRNLDTVPKYVQYLADKYPHRELFVFYSGEKRRAFTSRQVFQLAGKFAHRLRHQYGCKRGDVITNTLPNSPERLITDLGTTLAGCINLNGQIVLSDGEDFFLNSRKSRANAVIVCPNEKAASWRFLKPHVQDTISPDLAMLSCDRAQDLKTAITVSRNANQKSQGYLEELENSSEEIFVEPSIKPDEVAVVFTTSGSTGYSKLIPRSHTRIIDMYRFIGKMMGNVHYEESELQDSLYNDRPLGWGGGYPLSTFLTGLKRVLLDAFDMKGQRPGEHIWRAIAQEKCTFATLLPLDLDHVVRYVQKLGGSHYRLKHLTCGAQPLKQNHIQNIRFLADDGIVGYGSTEGGFLTQEHVSDYRDFLCGKPYEGVYLKVVNENNEECKPGEMGIIYCKGKQTFTGFFNRLEDPDPDTAKAFTEDGWFITEDTGYFDEDGKLYVLGRNKDVIMYGAAVVYPVWLEAKITEHPDIVEACVVPVSDPVLFHEICACVKPTMESNLTEEKLKDCCKKIFILEETEGELVPMPKYFLILREFPETATGKPDKQKLRAMAEEKFGYKENK